MARIDDLNINEKSDEANMKGIKAWIGNATDTINYHDQMILKLLQRIEKLEESED